MPQLIIVPCPSCGRKHRVIVVDPQLTQEIAELITSVSGAN